MKLLRIVFCVLCCLCVAATVPVGIFFNLYCLLCIAGALFFGSAMFLVIHLSRPRVRRPDFMNTDEENAEINAERAEHEQEKNKK